MWRWLRGERYNVEMAKGREIQCGDGYGDREAMWSCLQGGRYNEEMAMGREMLWGDGHEKFGALGM